MGVSFWLSSLPVEEHGFAPHKGALMHDALYLYYWWLPSGLPAHCACGQGLFVDHSLNFPAGCYPIATLQHNKLYM